MRYFFSRLLGPPRRPRVLIVDDDECFCELLAMCLRSFDCHACHSAEAALESYSAVSGYDYILVDLGLPRMDGRELIRKIRSQNPIQKIVVVTGDAEAARELRMLPAPEIPVVVKPITLDAVRSALAGAMERKAVHA